METIVRFFANITNEWFFDKPAPWMRYLLVFVKGDAIVILPLVLLIVVFGFISIDFMLVMVGLFVAARGLGEMMFWILQQFGPRTYRPYDFGFGQLDNNAIYIIYQLLGMSGLILGLSLVLMMIYF
jgi:hypothetical protein